MTRARRQLVICLDNDGYEASLETRKIYVAIPDADAAAHRQIRIIDESSTDYLYPARWFKPVELAPAIRKAVLASS
jgi:hypothetical protein